MRILRYRYKGKFISRAKAARIGNLPAARKHLMSEVSGERSRQTAGVLHKYIREVWTPRVEIPTEELVPSAETYFEDMLGVFSDIADGAEEFPQDAPDAFKELSDSFTELEDAYRRLPEKSDADIEEFEESRERFEHIASGIPESGYFDLLGGVFSGYEAIDNEEEAILDIDLLDIDTEELDNPTP